MCTALALCTSTSRAVRACRALVDGDLLAAGGDKTKDFALLPPLRFLATLVYGADIGDGFLSEYLHDNNDQYGYARRFHCTLDTWSEVQAGQYVAAINDVLAQGMRADTVLSTRAVVCASDGGWRIQVCKPHLRRGLHAGRRPCASISLRREPHSTAGILRAVLAPVLGRLTDSYVCVQLPSNTAFEVYLKACLPILEDRAGGALQLHSRKAPMFPRGLRLAAGAGCDEIGRARGARVRRSATVERRELARDVVGRGADMFGEDYQAVALEVMLARMVDPNAPQDLPNEYKNDKKPYGCAYFDPRPWPWLRRTCCCSVGGSLCDAHALDHRHALVLTVPSHARRPGGCVSGNIEERKLAKMPRDVAFLLRLVGDEVGGLPEPYRSQHAWLQARTDVDGKPAPKLAMCAPRLRVIVLERFNLLAREVGTGAALLEGVELSPQSLVSASVIRKRLDAAFEALPAIGLELEVNADRQRLKHANVCIALPGDGAPGYLRVSKELRNCASKSCGASTAPDSNCTALARSQRE